MSNTRIILIEINFYCPSNENSITDKIVHRKVVLQKCHLNHNTFQYYICEIHMVAEWSRHQTKKSERLFCKEAALLGNPEYDDFFPRVDGFSVYMNYDSHRKQNVSLILTFLFSKYSRHVLGNFVKEEVNVLFDKEWCHLHSHFWF